MNNTWEKQLSRRIGLANSSGNYKYFIGWVVKNVPNDKWLEVGGGENLPEGVLLVLSTRFNEL